MQEKNICIPNVQEKLITADEIINNLISECDVKNMQANLRELIFSFLLSYPDPTNDFKQSVYWTYRVLHETLEMIEAFENQNKNNILNGTDNNNQRRALSDS